MLHQFENRIHTKFLITLFQQLTEFSLCHEIQISHLIELICFTIIDISCSKTLTLYLESTRVEY